MILTNSPNDSSQAKPDRTQTIVVQNLQRIELIAIDMIAIKDPAGRDRAVRCLQNRSACKGPRPHVLLASLNEREHQDAELFADDIRNLVASVEINRQHKCTETAGNALTAIRRIQGRPDLKANEAKRSILFLSRRGGQSPKPNFVEPFTGGGGTTCGEWTRPVAYDSDGTPIKGFMKAAVTGGFCPVGCPFCYLQAYMMDSMRVNLNLDDLRTELINNYRRFAYPINFSEVSGLIEYDEFFSDRDGTGSIAQDIINICHEADVSPFFLTKIRFPDYLVFPGRVQVGISLMPEAVRKTMAPNGSPTDELLRSLAGAVERGARDPVVRLTTFWQYKDQYPTLLQNCRDVLGESGWRLTVDLMRFTPATAQRIANRDPKAAEIFAREITGSATHADLAELAHLGKSQKKVRPPADHQQRIYRWLRNELSNLGCDQVLLSPCKADASEVLPLVRDKTIAAMPCACYGCDSAQDIVKIDGLPRRRNE